jgi:excisionase family DNA binding protein
MNGMILGTQPEPARADPNEILTVQQAARALKVSYSHILRLIRGDVSGIPPVHHVRAGQTVRVRRSALTDWTRDVERLSAEAPAIRAGA